MRATQYNRGLLFLGFTGIFIAGVLSLSKLMDVVPPCGANAGCAAVTNDPSSMLFGVLPIAYIGFGAYLFLTLLALLRSKASPKSFMRLSMIGYGVAAFGALVSIGLQFYSIFVIGDLCKWCLGSAITMTATLIVYALMYQDASEHTAEQLGEAIALGRRTDFIWQSGFAAVTVIALAVQGYYLRFSDNTKGRILGSIDRHYPLIPPHIEDFQYGDVKAPVKVIEFADLNCPACQRDSPRLKDYVRQHEGQISVVFRNCPLSMHKTSQLAALIDCYAGEKHKFWQFCMAVMGTKREIKDPLELYAIAGSVGLDVDDFKRRMANNDDPLYAKLTNDENTAAAVGVSQTPTFVVEIPNQAPKAFTGGGMFDAFNQKPYSQYLRDKA